MVREEIVGQRLFSRLKERFRAISLGFLGPLFIVTVAFKVDFRAVIIAPLLFLAILIAAFVGKILGAGSGAYFSGSNVHDSVSIGLGMNGRGTVELVLAVVGLELGILTINHVTILVMVAFITTLVVPYALSMRIPRMSKHLLKK
jgi:Kef-type K+ transport system membrane component KefB